MSKFHINPATGVAGKCTASRSCPFGDLEADHYGSKEEAQAAYEKRMASSTVAAPARAKSIHDQGLEIAQGLSEEIGLSWKETKHIALKSFVDEFPDADGASNEEVLTHLSNMAIYRQDELRKMLESPVEKKKAREAGQAIAQSAEELASSFKKVKALDPGEIRKARNRDLINDTYALAKKLKQGRTEDEIRKRVSRGITSGMSPKTINDRFGSMLNDFSQDDWRRAVGDWPLAKRKEMWSIVRSPRLKPFTYEDTAQSRKRTSSSVYGANYKGYSGGGGRGKY